LKTGAPPTSGADVSISLAACSLQYVRSSL
jgi:hypothetical protein